MTGTLRAGPYVTEAFPGNQSRRNPLLMGRLSVRAAVIFSQIMRSSSGGSKYLKEYRPISEGFIAYFRDLGLLPDCSPFFVLAERSPYGEEFPSVGLQGRLLKLPAT